MMNLINSRNVKGVKFIWQYQGVRDEVDAGIKLIDTLFRSNWIKSFSRWTSEGCSYVGDDSSNHLKTLNATQIDSTSEETVATVSPTGAPRVANYLRGGMNDTNVEIINLTFDLMSLIN